MADSTGRVRVADPVIALSDKLVSLQILRGIAAIMVVWVHAQIMVGEFNPIRSIQGTYLFQDGVGAIGVDIFFLVSGVIITLTTREITDLKSVNRFGLKRFLRVAPYYWLFSALLAGWLTIRAPQFVSPGELVATFLFYPVDGFPVLVVGWTLCFEMLFYVCAYLWLLSQTWTLQFRIAAAAVVLVLLFRNIDTRCVRQFLLNPIILEFGLGVLIAKCYLRFGAIRQAYALTVLIVGTVLVIRTAIYGFGNIANAEYIKSAELSMQRFITWGIPSALIVFGMLNLEMWFRARKFPVLLLLGDASYSIYLIHMLFFREVGKLRFTAEAFPDLVIALSIVAAVAVSVVAYFLIERRISRINSALVRWLTSDSPRTKKRKAPAVAAQQLKMMLDLPRSERDPAGQI